MDGVFNGERRCIITSAGYTAADQTADRGAPLGPGASLDIRIAQIGQAFGPGAAAITTLWF